MVEGGCPLVVTAESLELGAFSRCKCTFVLYCACCWTSERQEPHKGSGHRAAIGSGTPVGVVQCRGLVSARGFTEDSTLSRDKSTTGIQQTSLCINIY